MISLHCMFGLLFNPRTTQEAVQSRKREAIAYYSFAVAWLSQDDGSLHSL
jgi:hypothetical protein